MNILVTGATGFVGRHLVTALLAEGHTVTAVARDAERAATMPWRAQVRFITCDLHDASVNHPAVLGAPDVLMHLAWPGLPNYRELFHFERTLPADYAFLKSMLGAGLRQLLVTGTCFEYGLKSGPLGEHEPSDPQNPYALAKDTLRKFLQALQTKQSYVLQWVRLFYLHGPGQNPNSLLAQLDQAIDAGDAAFNMSGGEQLRDYLTVTEVAQRLARLAVRTDCTGIINCCSSKPVSVRALVERRIAERQSNIKMNLGIYPYSNLEPMAFWGADDHLRELETIT